MYWMPKAAITPSTMKNICEPMGPSTEPRWYTSVEDAENNAMMATTISEIYRNQKVLSIFFKFGFNGLRVRGYGLLS